MKKITLPVLLAALASSPSIQADTVLSGRVEPERISEIKIPDEKKCSGLFSSGLTNKYRTSGGFVPVDAPIFDSYIGINCGKFGVQAWQAVNLDTNKVNEVDLGVWYHDSTKSGLNFGGGIEKFWFTEDGGDVLVGRAYANKNIGDFNVQGSVIEALDAKGRELSLEADRSFKLTEKLSTTPYTKFVGHHGGFFGQEDGLSNIVVGNRVDWDNPSDNGFDFSLSGEYHKGRNGVEDDSVFKLSASKNF